MPEANFNEISMPSGIDFSKLSRAELLALGTEEEVKTALATLSNEECHALLYDWDWFWSRPSQRPPEDPYWVYWLLRSGRGFGKTRTGAEFIRAQAKAGITPLA